MLKGQSEATPRCDYFFLCVKKKKLPLLTLKVATAFFEGKKKKENESPTNHFFSTMESTFPPGTQLIWKTVLPAFPNTCPARTISVTENLSRLAAEGTREESHQLVYSRKEVFIPRTSQAHNCVGFALYHDPDLRRKPPSEVPPETCLRAVSLAVRSLQKTESRT